MVDARHQSAAVRVHTYILRIVYYKLDTWHGTLKQMFYYCRMVCGMDCPQMWKIAWRAMLNTERTQRKRGDQMKTREDLEQILDASEQLLDGIHQVIDLITLAIQAVREEVNDRGQK